MINFETEKRMAETETRRCWPRPRLRTLLMIRSTCLRYLLVPALPIVLAGIVACGESGPDAPPEAAAPAREEIVLVSRARIYTMDAGNTVIDPGAMALSADGFILGIGDDAAMQDAFPAARRVDLGGRTVLPGLIDSHAHLYGLALSYTQANLVGAASKAEAIGRLRDFEATLADGEWLLGRGWDQNDWPEAAFPSRGDLDAEFPDRPVWLRRIDGHAAWANSLALAQADRDLRGDWQPAGGHVHRDAAGEPSGILIDRAMDLVDRVVPPVPRERIIGALDLAVAEVLSLGLTGVHDPGIDRDALTLFGERIEQGAFPLRLYALADGNGKTLDWLCENGRYRHPSGRLEMRSVKLYADGALGSRGAALLEDYADDPGNRGLLFLDDPDLEAALRRVFSCGLQAGIHAIGDAANRQVLDAYERLLPEFPENPGRHRIEHAQILAPQDLPRFARLGVIAAVQPTHATSDMYWAGERLGEERLPGAYAWRSLAGSGARLAFGSDFPVEEVNPFFGIHAAVTRQDRQGWPEGGWLPPERLGREAAIRAFTLDAAYAAFMEEEIGSLEAGKRADFIVLDRDVMQVPADEIAEIRVLQTWLDGKPVFER
jgi:predicted amidohydrolase YtcJ